MINSNSGFGLVATPPDMIDLWAVRTVPYQSCKWLEKGLLVQTSSLLSVTEFVAHASEVGALELRGFIAYDARRTDVVLFGYTPFACPAIPIPQERIANIRLGSTHPCHGGATGLTQMWDATLYLKQPEKTNVHALMLAELINASTHVAGGQNHQCTCSEKRFETSGQYCCSLFNDDGRLAAKQPIEAANYNAAVGDCLQIARQRHYPSGSVRQGPC